jgi:hypothetical protein
MWENELASAIDHSFGLGLGQSSRGKRLGWPLNLYHEQTNKRTEIKHRCVVCLLFVFSLRCFLCSRQHLHISLSTCLEAGHPPKLDFARAALSLRKFCVKFLDPYLRFLPYSESGSSELRDVAQG